ncbi:hypothetical protein GJ699_06965 [Duganella sp. FT80W]|uniref:Uncharacterized protein n=1 Tax=Duganella guangzhouensis TaxID=2666084 RepID=A0A6I2L0A9_9BURK|nr:DUF5908 family protein [Duganella guangzhouensis]MRW89719.1 hypothetical protein [Duganella guangzhouensis]
MAIEIRELVIKTTIVERGGEAAALPQAMPVVKEEILAACRQLVLSLLRERGER